MSVFKAGLTDPLIVLAGLNFSYITPLQCCHVWRVGVTGQ